MSASPTKQVSRGPRSGLAYIDVCSGISAPTMGWKDLGWRALCYADIDPAPLAVLKHHYPDVPRHGDFTQIKGDEHGAADLLVGGTPCQSFSVAGLRKGMDDERGNLALEYIRLAQRARTRWVVWENVPGVLTSSGGEDFRCFLAGLAGWDVPIPAGGWQNSGIIEAAPAELTWGLAWRILDAQHFGVPQRRRRIFVVGYLGDWRRAAAVLFERHSLSGNPPPRREKGQVAPTIPSRRSAGGGLGTDFDCDGGLIDTSINRMLAMGKYEEDDLAGALKARDFKDATDLIAHTLRGAGFDASEDGTGRGTPLVPVQPYVLMERGRDGSPNLEFRQDGTANAILTPNGGRGGLGVGAIAIQERAVCENPEAGPDGAGFRDDGKAYTLEARTVPQAVCFSSKDFGGDAGETSPTLRSGGHDKSHANAGAPPAVAFMQNSGDELRTSDVSGALTAGGGKPGQGFSAAMVGSAVRRLTPRECERLQGFPDDFTLVPHRGKPMADGPRYKMLGNSMAVPVLRWIGRRIQAVEDVCAELGLAA